MVRNVHERLVAAAPAEVGKLLDTLGSPNDRLWPLPPRAPMVLRHDHDHDPNHNHNHDPNHGREPNHHRAPIPGLAVGASGGHGSVRYSVETYEPGQRVVFRFTPGLPMTGTHAFTLDPAGGHTLVRHVLEYQPRHVMWILGPLFVLPMHDCYIEDALDRIERELGVGPTAEHRHSRWTRLLERRLARRVTSAEPILGPLTVGALAKIDAADAFRTDIVPGDGTDPAAWTKAIFAAQPWWVHALLAVRKVLMRPFGVVTDEHEVFTTQAISPTECVVGMDDKHLDFRAVVTLDERAGSVTLTTIVNVHSTIGKIYWSVVRHFHPVVVRSLMRSTAHPAGLAAAVPSMDRTAASAGR